MFAPPTYAGHEVPDDDIEFFASEGGANPANQTTDFVATEGGCTGGTISESASWLTVSPTTVPALPDDGDSFTITMSVDITGLTEGDYAATITINPTDSESGIEPCDKNVTITVELEIGEAEEPPCDDADGDEICDEDDTEGPFGSDDCDDGLDNDGNGDIDEADDNCVDLDSDDDTVNDGEDNCPNDPNEEQDDADGDDIGDACDTEGPLGNTNAGEGADDCFDGFDNDGDGATDEEEEDCQEESTDDCPDEDEVDDIRVTMTTTSSLMAVAPTVNINFDHEGEGDGDADNDGICDEDDTEGPPGNDDGLGDGDDCEDGVDNDGDDDTDEEDDDCEDEGDGDDPVCPDGTDKEGDTIPPGQDEDWCDEGGDDDGDDDGTICPDGSKHEGKAIPPGQDSDWCQMDDADEDGVPDDEDNCPEDPNTEQEDVDEDEIGDACDSEGPPGNENGPEGSDDCLDELDNDGDGDTDDEDEDCVENDECEEGEPDFEFCPPFCGEGGPPCPPFCGDFELPCPPFCQGSQAQHRATVRAQVHPGEAEDCTAPELTVSDMTVEATGPDGALVDFTTVSATDDFDVDVAIDCTPDSGSLFALGTTSVSCTAEDDHNNTDTDSFNVNVVDTTPPVFDAANDWNEESSLDPAPVFYNGPGATDIVDLSPDVVCTPASGTDFVQGTTLVTCTATDDFANMSFTSFNVTVGDNGGSSRSSDDGGDDDGGDPPVTEPDDGDGDEPPVTEPGDGDGEEDPRTVFISAPNVDEGGNIVGDDDVLGLQIKAAEKALGDQLAELGFTPEQTNDVVKALKNAANDGNAGQGNNGLVEAIGGEDGIGDVGGLFDLLWLMFGTALFLLMLLLLLYRRRRDEEEEELQGA